MLKKRLLIVHEDHCVSNFLAQLFSNPEMEYEIVSTYSEVQEKLSQTNYHVIITDLTINGNFTYRYLESIREKAPTSSIIVLSEMELNADKKTILKMGANDFVPLPLDIWSFIKKVDYLLCA